MNGTRELDGCIEDSLDEFIAVLGRAERNLEREREYLRPFDSGERERLVELLLEVTRGELGSPRASRTEGRPGLAWLRRVWARLTGSSSGTVGTLGWAGLCVASAAVAATLVYTLSPAPADPLVAQAEVPALAAAPASMPDYSLDTDAGRRSARSAGPEHGFEPLHYGTHDAFDWRLRPSQARDAPVAVELFAAPSAEAGQRRALPQPSGTQVADSGAVRLRGTIDELGLAAGEWTVTIELSDAPGQEQGQGQGGAGASARPTSDKGVRLVRHHLALVIDE